MSLRPLARAALTNSAWSAASLPPPGAWEHVVTAWVHAATAWVHAATAGVDAHVAGAAGCRGAQEDEASKLPTYSLILTYRGAQEEEVGAREGGWPVARSLKAAR